MNLKNILPPKESYILFKQKNDRKRRKRKNQLLKKIIEKQKNTHT